MLFIPDLKLQLEEMDMAITMRQVDHIIAQFDTNGDGYLDWYEFKKFLAVMNGESTINEIDLRH